MGAPTSRRSVAPSPSTSRGHRTLPKYDPIWRTTRSSFTQVGSRGTERDAASLCGQHLFPSLRVHDGGLRLGVDGVDYDLSRVVGARGAGHKVLDAAAEEQRRTGGRVPSSELWFLSWSVASKAEKGRTLALEPF
ncbi:hypothetical protein EYF80_067249 [Liparis tanakae]|uniref:Uncharacterized protein n=1 Tax=Liparis tanakae TaxID=230148 RepID=A0A4Z2E1L6_9TELE|nr:hypothetical protein EYF80_067249 [Liparis tanakae]